MRAGADDKSKSQESKSQQPNSLGFKEAVVVCAWALVLFFAFRAFAFQQFHIPSGSMKPTLLVGDSLAVSKFVYGYSRYSLPLSLPLFSGRVFAGEPSRGDVVVFRLPRNDSEDRIKRIVGLPGDRVRMVGGALHLNDVPVKRERLEDVIDTDEVAGRAVIVKRWRETLPNGVSYVTLDLFNDGDADDTEVFIVPPGHYFMMGDNRDASNDSRFSEVGFVPFENIVGQAKIIYFSIGGGIPAWQVWNWPASLRFHRVFMTVR
jgi:signal peptidase I